MKYSYKRVVAGFLAAVIVNGFGVPDCKASGGSPSGGGSLEGVLSDVFNVVVPTQSGVSEGALYNSKLDFIMDPHKLAKPGSGSFVDASSLEPDATLFFKNMEAGKKYDYSSTSDGFTVINKSTAAVDITLDAELSGMDGVKLTGDRAFTGDTGASVFLALTDNKGKCFSIDKFGAIMKTTLEGRLDAYDVKYVPSTDKYKYELKSDSALAAAGISFEEYIFRMTGACNSSNAWSKLSSIINPAVTVTWHVALRPKNVAPSIPKTSYVMNAGAAVLVGIDLGSGNLGASGVKSVTFVNGNGVTKTLSQDSYVFMDGLLKFKAAYVRELINMGISSRTYTVIFDDKAETKKQIMLVTDDMAPSVEQTGYTMINGQPVQVEVDLGAGTLAAGGIQSITFVNKSGVEKTLDTNEYVFANGVLEFKASYISAMLGNGVMSRDFVINLDDKANTSIVITLSAVGTAPSVAQTSYTVDRGDAVQVTVDLGSDALAANGIDMITFVNKAGVKKTLEASKYNFVGNILEIKGDYINELIDNGLTSRIFTITFDNVLKTQAEITVTAVDKAPEILQTNYTMTSGQPVRVDVDLGTGILGATGIQSITFVNKIGVKKTLEATEYVMADGVLKFKASYVTALIGNGNTSRDFEIMFNDAAKTSVTVTMSVSGNVPSIAQTSYTMDADGSAIAIDVELGDGGLAASGIESIAFVNLAGVTKTLTTNDYTFSGNTLTLTEQYITGTLSGAWSSRDYTVTFNNVVKTEVKITLLMPDVVPTIAEKQYKMVNGQPILVNLNLGAGNGRASGIKSVTYVDETSKKVTVVPSSYYVLEGNTLKFRAAYIKGVVSAKIRSRDYTVTFNDKAETPVIITFAQ